MIYEKEEITNIHGKKLIDEFSWMKNNKKKTSNVIEKANKIFNNSIDEYESTKKKLRKEFLSRMIHKQNSYPSEANTGVFQFRIKKGENYGRLYLKLKGKKEKVILDYEKLGKSHSFWNMTSIVYSFDETKILFSVDHDGSDNYKLYCKDIYQDKIIQVDNKEIKNSKNEYMSDTFTFGTTSNICFYVTKDSSLRSNKLWVVDLNNMENTHRCIYTEDDNTYNIVASSSSDNRFVFLYVSKTDVSEIYIVNQDDYSLKKIVDRREKKLISIDHYFNTWFALNVKYEKSEILFLDCDSKKDIKISNFKKLIPYEKEYFIENYYFKGDYMIVVNNKQGLIRLMLLNLKTNKKRRLIFPDKLCNFNISVLENLKVSENTLLINYNTWIRSNVKYKIDLTTGRKKIVEETRVKGYNYKKYSQKLINVNNSKLKMTIIYNNEIVCLDKDKKKECPCVLYGYGSYGVTITPEFNSSVVSLLDRGIIYCVAHIRGGGYHGKKWYDNGRMLKKMNTFNDFIECAEYLIDRKYTNPNILTVEGRSAGGLLIGSVINMRPELFNFAILGVPFVDVINTMMDDKLPLTTGEYEEWGDVRKKKYFDYIVKYSPYDNIDYCKNYPNIYIYSNLNDVRVYYHEPLKYYSRIKKSHCFVNNEKEILLKLNKEFGHTQSSKRYDSLDEEVEKYILILKHSNKI